MIAMNNALIDLLYYQQKMPNYTTHTTGHSSITGGSCE